MVYVIDFVGCHANNSMVGALIGGRKYQPIEIEGEMDSDDLDALESMISDSEYTIAFTETVEPPSDNVAQFQRLRNSIDTVVSIRI